MNPDKFPNIFVALLAQSLALSGSETEIFLSTIKTLDGQTMQTSDFAYLGRGILSVDVQSASRAEFISFTSVSSGDTSVTGAIRGLSFKDNTVIPANKKFHSVGAPIIIAFGTHNLIDLEQVIIDNQAAIEAQITALIAAIQTEYLALNGSNHPSNDIPWGTHKITGLKDGTNSQDAVTFAQLQAAIIGGGVAATTTQGGYVKVATQSEFDSNTDTTIVGPFTFYNMATVTQINSVGRFSFTYGESISVNDYVFQSTGLESNFSNGQLLQGSSDSTPLATQFNGDQFMSLSNALHINSISVMLRKVNSPTGTAVLRIYALSGGVPTGSVLATSNTFNVSTLTTSFSLIKFTFSSAFVPSASTLYGFYLDASSTTFSGSATIEMSRSNSATSNLRIVSSDGGATWNTFAGQHYFIIGNEYIQGSIYKTDPVNITNIGPYKGFAISAGTVGTSHPVQILNIASGFTGLTSPLNVYIDTTVPGGITQTVSSTSGRNIGIAVSSTKIQLSPMKVRSVGVSYTLNNVINQEGFLTISGSAASAGSFNILESDAFAITTTVIFTISLLSGQGLSITLPVRSGYSYSVSGVASSPSLVFYPLING